MPSAPFVSGAPSAIASFGASRKASGSSIATSSCSRQSRKERLQTNPLQTPQQPRQSRTARTALRKNPVLHRALDEPPASVVSRAGVSRHPPTLAEDWSAQRDRPRQGLEPLSNSALINEFRPLRVERRSIRIKSSSISYAAKGGGDWMRTQTQTPSGTARRRTSRAQFQSSCRTRGNHVFPNARDSHASPSKRVNQPLNRGHSARIFVNPIARATDKPSRRLRYPCTAFKIPLLGALSGPSQQRYMARHEVGFGRFRAQSVADRRQRGRFPSAFAPNSPACARPMKPREVSVRPTKVCVCAAVA